MTTEVGARLSPEQMEIRARARAAVEALTCYVQPAPRTWAAQAAGARDVVVAAFEGPVVEGQRVLLLFMARPGRVFALLALLCPDGRRVLEQSTCWPSQFYGCAIEALLRKLLIDARESPQGTPLMREVAAQIACIPDKGERWLWGPPGDD